MRYTTRGLRGVLNRPLSSVLNWLVHSIVEPHHLEALQWTDRSSSNDTTALLGLTKFLASTNWTRLV